MDFHALLAKMKELDRAPVQSAPAAEACGDPMGMPPAPMDHSTQPPPAHPSMSVNLNAQGLDNIESMMKLFQKVNPDMMPKVSPSPIMSPIPTITGIKPALPPLKMLPDFDADNDMKIGGEMDIDSPGMPGDPSKMMDLDKPEIPDALSKMDLDKPDMQESIDNYVTTVTILNPDFNPQVSDDTPEEIDVEVTYSTSGSYYAAGDDGPEESPEVEIKSITNPESGEDLSNRVSPDELQQITIQIHDMLTDDVADDSGEEDNEKKKDEDGGFQAATTKPREKFSDIDYMTNKLAGGMNQGHKTYPKVADGDNPMQKVKESEDSYRASIRAELLRRLNETKGAK